MKSLPILINVVDNQLCNFNIPLPKDTIDIKTYSNYANYKLDEVGWETLPTVDINSNNIKMFLSVFKNELIGFYIELVHDVTNENIYMIVTDNYSPDLAWTNQKMSAQLLTSPSNVTDLTSTYFMPSSNIEGEVFKYNNLYSCPVAKIKIESDNTELYCNYLNNCIEISTVDVTDVTRHTYNMFCGVVKKHHNWDKGWMFGGTSCGVVQTINRIAVVRKSKIVEGSPPVRYGELSFLGTDTLYVDDPEHHDFRYHVRAYKTPPSNNPSVYISSPMQDGQFYIYNTAKPNIRFNNNFDCFIRIDVDDAPLRGKNWASNISSPTFTKMYSSYSMDSVDLPTYRNLMSKSLLDRGKVVNTLNSIALCMPIYFMVLRDPNVLNNYSSIGYTDIINYVSMAHISSGSIYNTSFPVNSATKYRCFSLYKRRMSNQFLNKNWYEPYKDGFVGYAGIAIKTESEGVSILNWGRMKANDDTSHPMSIIHNDTTGITTINWSSMYPNTTYRALLLSTSYNYFDKIKIRYSNDSATFVKEIIWDSVELKKKLRDTSSFDLFNGDEEGLIWTVVARDDIETSQTAWFVGQLENSGIVDIIGI